LSARALALHTAVARQLALRVAEVVGTADRNLTVVRGADLIRRGRGDVTFRSAYALHADRAVAVFVHAAERRRRVRIGEGARTAKALRVAKLGGLLAAFVTAAQTSPLDAVGRQVGTLAAVDALADLGLAQAVSAARPAGALRLWAAEQLAAVVRACEAGRALKIELTGVGKRRTEVVDAEVADVAVAVDQAAAKGLGPAAIAEVAFESRGAIDVRVAFGDRGDVAAAVGPLTIAPDWAVAVGEADAEIVGEALIAVPIAIAVRGAVEVTLARDLDPSMNGARPVDRTTGEKKDTGQEGDYA